MRQRRLLIPLAFTALLGACAQTSGVMPLGPDTFSIVTTNELGGVLAAKKAGLEQANAYCASRGQQMVVMQSQSDVRPDWVGDPVAHHDVTFRCLNAGDSQLSRPVVGANSNSLIVR